MSWCDVPATSLPSITIFAQPQVQLISTGRCPLLVRLNWLTMVPNVHRFFAFYHSLPLTQVMLQTNGLMQCQFRQAKSFVLFGSLSNGHLHAIKLPTRLAIEAIDNLLSSGAIIGVALH